MLSYMITFAQPDGRHFDVHADGDSEAEALERAKFWTRYLAADDAHVESIVLTGFPRGYTEVGTVY